LCDAADGRHVERQGLFKRWYNRHVAQLLQRFPIEIETDEYSAYGCIMVLNDFSHMEVMQAELISKVEDIIFSKYSE
jgi:hypothetical protein